LLCGRCCEPNLEAAIGMAVMAIPATARRPDLLRAWAAHFSALLYRSLK
jgi:hypothetical protein